MQKHEHDQPMPSGREKELQMQLHLTEEDRDVLRGALEFAIETWEKDAQERTLSLAERQASLDDIDRAERLLRSLGGALV
jgi:hypothetical protein